MYPVMALAILARYNSLICPTTGLILRYQPVCSTLLGLSSKIFLTSHNSLAGPLAAIASQLTVADQVDFSSNFLLGSIPESFGQLEMLTYLNLSDNSFEGSIPGSFEKLASLAELDLCFNNLAGTIPEF